jgi:hypothetical protein
VCALCGWCYFGVAATDGTSDLNMVSFVAAFDVVERHAFVLLHVDTTLAERLVEGLLFTEVVKSESTCRFLLPVGDCSAKASVYLGERPDLGTRLRAVISDQRS